MYTASNFSIKSSVWNNITVTVDPLNSNVKFYLNNSNVFTQSNVELSINANANSNLEVARNVSSSNYFKGSIDSINLYDSVINEATVQDLSTFKIMHTTLDTNMITSSNETSGFNATVTLSNSPTATNFGYQVGNQAITLNSNQAQAVVVDGESSKDTDINRITLSAWVKPSDISGNIPILFKNGSFLFGLDSGKPYVGLPNINSFYSLPSSAEVLYFWHFNNTMPTEIVSNYTIDYTTNHQSGIVESIGNLGDGFIQGTKSGILASRITDSQNNYPYLLATTNNNIGLTYSFFFKLKSTIPNPSIYTESFIQLFCNTGETGIVAERVNDTTTKLYYRLRDNEDPALDVGFDVINQIQLNRWYYIRLSWESDYTNSSLMVYDTFTKSIEYSDLQSINSGLYYIGNNYLYTDVFYSSPQNAHSDRFLMDRVMIRKAWFGQNEISSDTEITLINNNAS